MPYSLLLVNTFLIIQCFQLFESVEIPTSIYSLLNIRMDLEEIGINAGNWVDSAQDRNYWRSLVNVALNLWVP